MAYTVVNFSKLPYEGLDEDVVVPNSWIRLHSKNALLVAYPSTENPARTKLLIERKENYSEDWSYYVAIERYVAESLNDAYRWIAGKKYLQSMTNSSEQLANSLEKSHGHRLCETKYSNNKVEGVRLSASSMELFNGAKKNDPLDSNSEPRILPAPVLKNNPSRANSQPRKRPFPSTYGSKSNSQPSKIAKETISQTNYIRKSSIESGLMSSQKSQGLVDKVHLTPLVNIREVSPKVLNSTSTPKQNSIRSVATPFSKRTETSQGKQCSSANKHVKDAHDRKSSLDQSGSTNFSKITKETSMMDVDGVKVISTSDTLGLTAKLHAHRVPLRDNKATSSYADASTENNSDLFSKNTVNKAKEVFEPLPFKEFRTMFGRKSCSDLKVANFSIYVTKLDKSVTEQDIRKYLLKYNINVIDVSLLRVPHKTNYSSFKVTVDEASYHTVFNEHFWPRGVIFGLWQDNQ